MNDNDSAIREGGLVRRIKYRPDSLFKYFVFDQAGDGMTYFSSIGERDSFAQNCIENYKDDDGWDESVGGIVVGEVTATARECDVLHRPKTDENGCDENGMHWPDDIKYQCNYKLLPLKEG